MTRKITTAAELDALPFPNAVTFPGYGDWHKRRDGRWLCDDGDVLASGALALVANGELTLTGDPSSPAPAPSVVPEAAVERAARAMQAENAPKPDPLNRDQREEQDDATIATYRTLARAALTAALPLMTAAPSATREEVGEALHPGLFSLADYEYARHFDNHGAEARAQHQEAVLADEVDPLLARYDMTRKVDR